MTTRMFLSNGLLRSVLILSALSVAAATAVLAKLGLGPVDPLQIVDGTYQTFGMLDRLARGQLPGIDYVPYLGIILNYALAPAFLVLGSNVYAAFAAAELATCLAWLFVCCALCWAAGFCRRAAMGWGSLFFLAGALVSQFLPSITPGYLAGFSLLLLRECAVLPVLLAAAWITNETHRFRAMAAISGAMVFWSPSSGAAQFLATGFTILTVLFRSEDSRRAQRTVEAILIAALSLFVVATLISFGHPLEIIRHVFIDAGNTQFWFFEGFQNADRVLSLSDLSRVLARRTSALLYGIIATAGYLAALREHGLRSRRGQVIVLLALAWLASGMASQLAGHIAAHYMLPFYSGGAILLCARLTCLAGRRPLPPGSNKAAIAAVGLISGSALGCAYLFPIFRANESVVGVYEPALGLPLPTKAKPEIDFLTMVRSDLDRVRTPPSRRIFSTYYSWPDILLGASPRPQFNSIIHVLSDKNRDAFIRDFRQTAAPWAATLDPSYNDFALWNVRASWFFYRELIANYDPVFRGAATTYWRRRARPLKPVRSEIACLTERKDGKTTILRFLGNAERRSLLLDVSVDYDADPGPASLYGDLGRGYLRLADRSSGLLKRLRRGIGAEGPFPPGIDASPGAFYGLPAGKHSIEIPVEHDTAEPSSVELELQGSHGGSLKLERCRIISAVENPLTRLNQLPSQLARIDPKSSGGR